MKQAFLPSMILISSSIRGPAEDGKGTILRFIDLGGEPRTVTIHTPLLSISKIVDTDAVERDQKPIVPEDVHTFKNGGSSTPNPHGSFDFPVNLSATR